MPAEYKTPMGAQRGEGPVLTCEISNDEIPKLRDYKLLAQDYSMKIEITIRWFL